MADREETDIIGPEPGRCSQSNMDAMGPDGADMDITVAGIDVGGPGKRFHCVALRHGRYLDRLASRDAGEMAAWCRDRDVRVVGVDAPCQWSPDGRARAAEAALSRAGIQTFATPTRDKAVGNGFYAWMLAGEALYGALAQAGYPLLDSPWLAGRGRACFETFPQAVACYLAGRRLSAKHKATERRALLAQAGIDVATLSNQDWVDGALCALTAQHLAKGTVNAFGDAASGFILVPASDLERLPPPETPRQATAKDVGHLEILPVRLRPGTDLRDALTALPRDRAFAAGFILSAVGSLGQARLRLAGAETVWERTADFEILTLSGTLGPDGPHLHLALADATGALVGGHVLTGCLVRTTAEIMVGIVSGWAFRRAIDPATGYPELRLWMGD